ncbi:SH3 domain-containing protein [Mariniluteicoccus flavus]
MQQEPHREELADAPASTTVTPDAEVATGLVPFVRRYALPGILAASVGLGVLGGAMTPARSTEAVTAAAPADVRTLAPEISRDMDREPLGEPTTTPTEEPTPSEAPAPSQAPANLVAAAPAAPAAPASPEQSKTAKPSEKPSVNGTMFATETLNVRATPSASGDKVASLSRGDKVSITGKTQSGFHQVVLNDRAAWASSEYLSKSAPANSPALAAKAPAPAPATKSAAAAPKAGSQAPVTTGACRPLPGVTANAERVHQAICARFGSGVSSYIGVRPDWDVEHPSGRAVDAMVSDISTGQAIANYVRANAGSLGVTEVIFNQQIWTTQRASEGWRSMSDRGSATANHRDHVHISVR